MPAGRCRALLAVAAIVTSVTVPALRSGAATTPARISVTLGYADAFTEDAPDPHTIRVGSTYYTYTTGTTWGNHIGILKSSSPNTGFHTITGHPWGSSAFPSVHWSSAPASWQVPGTQVAPGVLFKSGRYVLYYSAQRRTTHEWCLSIATSSSPEGPFVDRTGSKPFYCMDNYGGIVDPAPFVDGNGHIWLYVKSNTGSRAMSAKLWAIGLDSSGTKVNAIPKVVLTQDSRKYPWETTIENPQMILRGGQRYLLYSGNRWDSSNYGENYALCVRADGPCTRARSTPFLKKYGSVLGPGGATAFSDASGKWWLTYHAWKSPCTNYGCGGKRRLYVQPLRFG